MGISSTFAPSVSIMRLTLAFCKAKPNWMPMYPKLMFQSWVRLRSGFLRDVIEVGKGVPRLLVARPLGANSLIDFVDIRFREVLNDQICAVGAQFVSVVFARDSDDESE